MRLTLNTDFSLRVLIQVGLCGDNLGLSSNGNPKGDSRFDLMLRVDTHGDLDPSSERNVVPVAGHFVFNEGARRLLTWPARRFWNRGSAAAKIPTGAAEDKKSRAPSRGSVGY
jgi:hypothetical protein